MTTARMRGLTGSVALVALLALTGSALAEEVGTVAAVEGSARIGRTGTWTAATIGAPIQRGDDLLTGTPGRMRIVFQDDSVLALGDDSRVTVNEQVFNGDTGKAKSMMELLKGKVTAVVSDYYHRAGNTYEIKTVTAVAGVRGTEFVMTFSPQDETTEVIGISGHIEVHSLADPTGPGVLVTANESTTVEPGKLPTSPEHLNDTIFRQNLEGIDFIGQGRPESLTAAATGQNVPAADRAGAVGAHVSTWSDSTSGVSDRRDASSLIGENPQVVKSMSGQLGISIGRR